jgi:hypothetical protein
MFVGGSTEQRSVPLIGGGRCSRNPVLRDWGKSGLGTKGKGRRLSPPAPHRTAASEYFGRATDYWSLPLTSFLASSSTAVEKRALWTP